jgi:hypothetical protein
MRKDVSVGTEASYGMNGSGSIPEKGNIFLSFTEFRLARGFFQLLIQRVSVTSSSRIKWTEREAGLLLPSCSDEKIGAVISTIHPLSEWYSA